MCIIHMLAKCQSCQRGIDPSANAVRNISMLDERILIRVAGLARIMAILTGVRHESERATDNGADSCSKGHARIVRLATLA